MRVFEWDIPGLSERSGISEAGLRKMLNTGAFKLEGLEKISNAFGIPSHILQANITIGHTKKDNEFTIIIEWFFGEDVMESSTTEGKKIVLSEKINPEKISHLLGPVNEMEDEVAELRNELAKKNDKIEHLEFKNKVLESTAEKMENVANTYEKQLKFYDELLSGLKEKLENPSKSVE